MMSAAMQATQAPTQTERSSWDAKTRELALELLDHFPPDLLVALTAKSALGLLAEAERRLGVDPVEMISRTETHMFLNEPE